MRTIEIRGHRRAILEMRDVEREMMAVDAPSPRRAVAGITEDGEHVIGGVIGLVVALDLGNDGFEPHDVFGAAEATLAEGGAENRHRGQVLGCVHLLERDATTFLRYVVPIEALARVEGEAGAGALLQRQAREKIEDDPFHHAGETAPARPAAPD
jgi:hypothetical protein